MRLDEKPRSRRIPAILATVWRSLHWRLYHVPRESLRRRRRGRARPPEVPYGAVVEDAPDGTVQRIRAAASRPDVSAVARLEGLMESLRLEAVAAVDRDHTQEMLDFHLGTLLAYAGDAAEASRLIERSRVLPLDMSDTLYPFSVTRSLELHALQLEAIRSGVPTIWLASMPRAASVSLTQNLGRVFAAPVMRASIGRFPDWSLMESWSSTLNAGGAILHDHFGPSAWNRRVLKSLGVSRVALLLRDPRAAAVSLARFGLSHSGVEGRVTDEVVLTIFESYLRWLEAWMRTQEQGEISVLTIHWGQVARAEYREIATVVNDFFGGRAPVTSEHPVRPERHNWVDGTADAWLEHVSPSAAEQMTSALSNDVRRFLALD